MFKGNSFYIMRFNDSAEIEAEKGLEQIAIESSAIEQALSLES